MSNKKIPITVAEGDGIGPEIMAATLKILKAANAPLDIHKVEIGEKVYMRGLTTGIEPSTWDLIRNTKAFLKAPITTPQGGGFKSLNVTIRTTLGLYANVRPCVAYTPFIESKHPGMDVVIIRENEEDLYTGIEYRQTHDAVHALKIITRQGCERIIRYAFEYALAHGRKKVTCFTKDNILKMSDGLFHKIFDEISPEYPSLEKEHWIVDIGAAKLADTPTSFDVVVLPNLYGDILSDVAAQIAGSVGLAGSANIGKFGAMFEAIHGSAPRRAGQNLANPSGLLLASVMMLAHLNLVETAEVIHNAWLCTIEGGIHTYDIFKEKTSRQKVGTQEFADAVIERLGKIPHTLKPAKYVEVGFKEFKTVFTDVPTKKTVGVDVFIEHTGTPESLAKKLNNIKDHELILMRIFNRGVCVWPNVMPETAFTDQWRCRFMDKSKGSPVSHKQIVQLLDKLADEGVNFIHTENLCTFDDKPGYSVTQDE